MKLFVLLGSRKGNYPDQYAPEALAVTDEFSSEDNPEWITDMKKEKEATGEFDALVVIALEVSDVAIKRRLQPEDNPIKATVIDE